MEDRELPYRLEISFDGERWREMPLGYRQDGTILEKSEFVVVQSIGRGQRVYYRAVATAGAEG